MAEQRGIRSDEIRPDFPAKVVELLARPKLTDLPDNPVGGVLAQLRAMYPDFEDQALPEIIDFAAARASIGDEAGNPGADRPRGADRDG